MSARPSPLTVELPRARAAFTTRDGGVSEGPYRSLNLGILTGDDRGRVEENRRRALAACGLEPDGFAMGRQVHGPDLRDWDEELPREDALPEVDGHLTTQPGLALLVLVADCLPVALAGGGRVAMLHCGWRGLAAGILERALERFDEPPAAALGPAIGRCCYEVGDEVLEAFARERAADPSLVAGRNLDLRGVARMKLEAAGVERLEHVEACTSCRADLFFSHRRDGGVTGRQAGLVWSTGP